MNTLDLISNGSRRYGVIECDPMIQKGLEKTVSGLPIILQGLFIL